MITRLRLLVLLARPAVVVILAMFTAVGLAQTGRGEDYLLLVQALVVVIGFLLFSVACNDLADEAIDRINLPGDRRRPLVTGAAGRRDLVVAGLFGAVVALGVSDGIDDSVRPGHDAHYPRPPSPVAPARSVPGLTR